MKIELKQLQAAFATTFVYITHDQSEALVLSDHIGVMNHGRFEQLGTPQELYYSPASAFVAGFVGANNRLAGKALAVNGALVQLATSGGWVVHAHRQGPIAAGMAVEAFIRPEATLLARSAAELPAGQTAHTGEVISLLFDGANSAVLLRELQSRVEFRIALPQTGAYADLQAGARIYFSFDPQRAICFAAADGHA
jgi:spermidine/putrescine transport system ATP-binding protein